MVVKADKERLTTLLKDTITLLCKNGLTFRSKFNIEALIGVTLDDDDVLLISMNELVRSSTESHLDDENSGGEAASKSAESGEDQQNDIQRKRHRKRRRRSNSSEPHGKVKKEAGNVEVESTRDGEYSNQPDTQLANVSGGFGETQQDYKSERLDFNEEDDDEIILVKTEQAELDDAWNASELENSSGYFPVPGTSQTSGGMGVADGTGQGMAHQGYPAGEVDQSWMEGDLSQRQKSSHDMASMSAPMLDISCELCGKSFQNRASFQRHKNTHAGIYQYQCDVCGKGFSSSTTYRGHKSVHTGIKEFKCNLCGKEYSHKRSLNDHLRFTHII